MKKERRINFFILFLTISIFIISITCYKLIRGDKFTITNINLKSIEEDKLFFIEPDAMPMDTNIKVYKGRRMLELYGDGKILGRFKIGIGRAPEGDKEKEGDRKTPEGIYYICTHTNITKYTYFMGLSYPNVKDAELGLKNQTIDKSTFDKIKSEIEAKKQPPWNTPLGGAVGIHGGGNKSDWTYGCIALSDQDILIISKYAKLKTKVEIFK